jgi:hypothetical protein
MSGNRSTYMPAGDDDYIDWEGNLLTAYPPYRGLFGDEVIEEQDLEAKVEEHGLLVALRDAARHAEEYKQSLNAVRGQIIDGPEQQVQVDKPDPKIELMFTAAQGGHVKEYSAWVKRIKASPKYNKETHGLIFRIEPGPLPPPDYINLKSTGYTEWDGAETLKLFRTIPRGADGYEIFFDLGDGREDFKGASGKGHGTVKAPVLPVSGLLMFKLITHLTNGVQRVGQPTWQVLNLQRDLPAKFGVVVEQKKGTPEL